MTKNSKNSKIKVSDVLVVELEKKHKPDIEKFKSFQKDLSDFLVEDALYNQQIQISKTYLFYYKNKLVSYVTILNDAINLKGDLKKIFSDKGVFYKSLPAMKIGRMCVDKEYEKRGLGTLMIRFAIQKAIFINNTCSGCRFITLDAKRYNKDTSRDTIHFYKKFGFKILKEREKGETSMYLDLSHK